MAERRYAIYFAPEGGSGLARMGWAWLGREPASDRSVSPDTLGLAPERHAAFTTAPRLYGLHATLKAPFRLARGVDRSELVAAMTEYCATRPPIEAPPLTLAAMDGFLAMRLSVPAPAVDALASDCVTRFDRFRAPASANEVAKRVAAGLTMRQTDLLSRWGYPYVMDEFRFHVSLTGRLEAADRADAREALKDGLRAVEREPLAIRSLCLFEQPAPDAWFVLTERLPFGG